MPTAVAATPATVAAVDLENTPLAAPAISAANPTPQGEARGLPINLTAQALQASVAGAPNEAKGVPGSILAAHNAPVDDVSVGREFSEQLVAAIAASKEQAHGAGNTSAAVQQVIASHTPAASTAAAHADPVITRPVGAAGWTEEVGNHVVWLANRSESRAELVLTPPQMGRVEISLTVKGDQAVASFASSNPVVREALEAALPRLREVLADAGIQLGQAQVGAENARQWAQQDKHGDNSASDPARANLGDTAISLVNSGSLSTPQALKGGRGLVDVFA
jgi:flagellar hook-length control protein FliK